MDRRSEPLVSVCRVERGLYALHYVEAPTSSPPVAQISVLSGDITIVPAPGRATDVLDAPGRTMVILAETPGEFEIKVIASRGDSTDAKFSVDLLDPGEQRRKEAPRPSTGRPGESRPSNDLDRFQRNHGERQDVSVRAHVSRRGDVLVGAGQWVAGPDEILPVEGLSIATGLRDLDVLVRVQSLKSGNRWSRWHDAEEFAGSRQQADSLTAIALALSGDAAAQFEISAEVMALGMPSTSKRGKVVEFYGVDPIVGFRLSLQSVNERTVAQTMSPPPAPLRVFRAKR